MEPASTPASTSLSLQYTVTQEDVQAFRQAGLQPFQPVAAQPRYERAAVLIATPFLLIFLLFTLAYCREVLEDIPGWRIILVAVAALFAVMVWGICRRREVVTIVYQPHMGKHLTLGELATIGPHAVTFSAAGMELEEPLRKVAYPAAAFHDVVRGSSCAAFRFFPDRIVLVPLHAFQDIEGREPRLAEAERILTMARGANLPALVTLLRHAPVPCPKCGYNLQGSDRTTCPECGEELTLDRLLRKLGR